jgi:hypothetical protein
MELIEPGGQCHCEDAPSNLGNACPWCRKRNVLGELEYLGMVVSRARTAIRIGKDLQGIFVKQIERKDPPVTPEELLGAMAVYFSSLVASLEKEVVRTKAASILCHDPKGIDADMIQQAVDAADMDGDGKPTLFIKDGQLMATQEGDA